MEAEDADANITTAKEWNRELVMFLRLAAEDKQQPTVQVLQFRIVENFTTDDDLLRSDEYKDMKPWQFYIARLMNDDIQLPL